MHDSDLFVCLCRHCNFSVTVAEAQIAGTPVLVGDVISTANIVVNGKSGFTLRIDEPQSFIEKINYYYGMWSNDKAKYLQMRLDVFNVSKDCLMRMCCPYALYLKMIEEFIKN